MQDKTIFMRHIGQHLIFFKFMWLIVIQLLYFLQYTKSGSSMLNKMFGLLNYDIANYNEYQMINKN